MNLFVSFSGGKSSAYMTKKVLDESKDNIVVVFANTGQENEQTLKFVDMCDKVFGFNTVWVEAITHQSERKGATHRVVSYDTASRDGQPYEDMIKKYGLPNKPYPHCTRELKLNPMISYIKSIGWKDYITAIGIRADEKRRVGNKPNIVYPLVDWFPSDKQDVNDFWEDQIFNLDLKEHQGNCMWCWKKSDKKLLRLIKESPDIFDFPRKMELSYGSIGNGSDIRDKGSRVFFRGRKSTNDLFLLADELNLNDDQTDPDSNSGCSESCEILFE